MNQEGSIARYQTVSLVPHLRSIPSRVVYFCYSDNCVGDYGTLKNLENRSAKALKPFNLKL